VLVAHDGPQTGELMMKNFQAGRVRLTTMAMFGLLAAGVAPAAAQQADARAACTHDAFQLCSSAMPDVERTKACLAQHRGSLSPACRSAMSGGGGGRVHHHYRHHRHR
jgi:hypothetical protein